ncbi:MAG: hypothetical protein OCD02_03270 [Spirochaetaceae bacterium]
MSEKLGCIGEQYSENTTSLNYISITAQHQRLYDNYLENLASDSVALVLAKSEGFKKGFFEGILIGILKCARNMLKEGCEIGFISKITSLSIEEINNLK